MIYEYPNSELPIQEFQKSEVYKQYVNITEKEYDVSENFLRVLNNIMEEIK